MSACVRQRKNLRLANETQVVNGFQREMADDQHSVERYRRSLRESISLNR